MAEDITTVPISLRSKFKSIRILAITGSAEMESAVPTKSANIRVFAPTSAPRNCGKNSAAPNPIAKGITTPRELTRIALRP
jgi:hypothetical protein